MNFKKLGVALVAACLMSVLAMAGTASAKNNTTEYTWENSPGNECTGVFRTNPNGLVQEWRDDPDCEFQGVQAVHLVFQPRGDQWPSADCETEVWDPVSETMVPNPKFLHSTPWTAKDYGGALSEVFTNGDPYWVCFYSQ